MWAIVEEVIGYIRNGKPGELLRDAEQRFGPQDLRFFCTRLAGWWYGSLFTQPPFQFLPSLPLENVHPWQQGIQHFIDAVPALSGLIRYDDAGLHMRDEVTEQEMLVIQQWVTANYRPHMSFALR